VHVVFFSTEYKVLVKFFFYIIKNIWYCSMLQICRYICHGKIEQGGVMNLFELALHKKVTVITDNAVKYCASDI